MHRLYDHSTQWEAVAELDELAEHVADLPLGTTGSVDVATSIANDMRKGVNIERVVRTLAEHDIELTEYDEPALTGEEE